MDRLEEIRQRTEAATDGPWERFDTPEYAEIHVLGGKEAGFLPVALADEAYNADFVAHSREDIPYLLSEVDRLTAALTESQRRERAAVEDIYLLESCDVCTHYDSQNNECTRPLEPSGTCFEWRGQQAGEGGGKHETD